MTLVERTRYFINHRFVRNSVVLQAGNVAGVLVQACAGILIARLLGPELFGQYSVAFSVASIVTILLGAGVQDAVAPQAARAWAVRDDRMLRAAIGFWAKFSIANIIATVAVVFAIPAITAHFYHSGTVGQYASVIIIATLVSTTAFTLTQLVLQVAGRIRALSTLTFVDVVTRYALVIGLMLAGLGVWGAVVGHLIGALVLLVVSMVVYAGLCRRYPQLPRLPTLFQLARVTRWRPLVGPTMWVMLDRNLGMLYGALPVAMVGLYAVGPEVAYFKLAFGYLMLAMTALGPISTLLNVHFPTVQVTNQSRLWGTFVRVTLYSTLMTTAITAVALAIAPVVFRLLYGAAYLPSIPYVYGFGLFGALFGLGVGLGPMWRAVNRVRVSIIINLATLGLGMPLGIYFITQWHIWGAVVMVTLWYTVSHVVSFAYLLRALKSNI